MAPPLIVSQQQDEWHLCNVVETKPIVSVWRSEISRDPHKTESLIGECVPSINHIEYIKEREEHVQEKKTSTTYLYLLL